MRLSIVIVNYNVKFFLEQCLHAVYKATADVQAEVFVVDNNSVDGSCAMVREKFPQCILIENKTNTGFSVANNQAIRISNGQYVLLLNPDTVVEENTFEKVLHFMDEHPEAGGLGVKMIDGQGRFLPESKRGLPTPMVSFYKIFGLSRLFPKSKKFGRYHLGFLDNNQVHEIDVLAGAFMLMRKETLDKVGLLDETFFMYGEDIDLSYRIILGGYKNYYFPETTIIHYKGESTKKGSINYVKVFYNAMIIFARKHFGEKNARMFTFFINLAIYFRAMLAIVSRAVKSAFLPVLDSFTIFMGIWLIASKWEDYKFSDGPHFPLAYFLYVVPFYMLIWLSTVWFSGGYEKPVKLFKVSRGILAGTGVILIIYALLPESLRFSRIMILLGTIWALVGTILTRLALHFSGLQSFKFDWGRKKRIAIVGQIAEAVRIIDILKQSLAGFEVIGIIGTDKNEKSDKYIGTINQLKEVVRVNKVNEIVFCADSVSAQQIIREMLNLEGEAVLFKIAPPESISIIGSNSIDTAGDLYVVDFNNITKRRNVRIKRLFDLFFTFIILLFYPILIFFIPKPLGLLRNGVLVFLGFKTWVGFYYVQGVNTQTLPKIRNGVTSLVSARKAEDENLQAIENINLMYAKDFKIRNELSILFTSYRQLGRT